MQNAPVSVRGYPDWLEAAWLERARAEGGLDALEGAARGLSDRFTTERPERFADYFRAADARAAYGIFFFPQSWVRARLALAEAAELGGWQCPANPRVLDLGAGLGACGLGACALLRELCQARNVELTALDYSQAALFALERLARSHAKNLPGLSVRAQARDLKKFLAAPPRATRYDLVVAGFALNEIWEGFPAAARADLIERLGALLAPGGLLLVLEPALKRTALALQEASDTVAKRASLVRIAPYAQNFPCPVCARGKYWPHDVRRWAPPETLRALNRRLWREVDALKFHWAAWSNRAPQRIPDPEGTRLRLRLCTPFALLKGRFECAGVAPDGRLVRADLPTRGLDKTQLRALEAIERGDTLFLGECEPLAADRMRIPSPARLLRRYSPQ